MNYVFVVERYNDLDMAAPVIWKAATRPDANVIVVNSQPRRISTDDFRLSFLASRPRVTLLEICTVSRGIARKLRRFWLVNIYYRYLCRQSDADHRVDVSEFPFDAIPVDRRSPTVVVVSYYIGHPAATAMLQWARERGFGRALIMHGIAPLADDPDAPHPPEPEVPLHAIFVNNRHTAAQKFPWASESELVYAGIPRYSTEWSHVYDRILPPSQDLASDSDFVIVFMLSKWKRKDDRLSTLSAISAAAKIGGARVIVKPHTRGMVFRDQLPDGIKVADDDIHARQLIQLSDVLVFTRSSIFIDAVFLDKPVIRLSYATRTRPASDLLDSCKVSSETGLLELLSAVKNGNRTYSRQAREKLLEFFVGDDSDGGLLERFVDKLARVAR